jgi:hypothetical protein
LVLLPRLRRRTDAERNRESIVVVVFFLFLGGRHERENRLRVCVKERGPLLS